MIKNATFEWQRPSMHYNILYMRNAFMSIALAMLASLVCHAQGTGRLENESLVWQWNLTGEMLSSILKTKDNSFSMELTNQGFQVTLGDGSSLSPADFKLLKPAHMENLPVEPASPTLARHFTGQELILELVNESHHLSAIWSTSLREGARYARQSLTLRAVGQDVLMKDIVLFDQNIPGAETCGLADGSPVVAGDFFCGCEHPMSKNTVSPTGEVQCRLSRNAVLKNGETLTESLVLGVAKPGQLRRSFLAYVERERTHPYRTFLHYNSWFDIAWDKQKFNEAQSLNVIEQFGRELVTDRGVKMDSFLFDDGWDDDKTLWHFHSGFPNGFTGLKAAAASYHSGIGVWISPFGGYDVARQQRLEYGSRQGYETNSSGFSLSGPKYYDLFRGICREMIQKYGVNQFKFDGLAAGAMASQSGLTRDGDAMLQLVADLRATDPDIYINQTTGTWPSPFWLLNVDSTWRGGADHDFQGQGSWCQQWMTYRDAQTYANVVNRAPLYPVTALMLHGIIYATNALHLATMSDADFSAQVREFFGNGTQLQELYITPALLNQTNWDDLAEAAIWSRLNADVLADTHWIGGDPGKGEIYGWAAWSPRLGILTLRNPTNKPAVLALNLQSAFELPAGSADRYQLKVPWKNAAELPPFELSSRETHKFNLRPFEILTLEAKANSGGDRSVAEALGGSTSQKNDTLQ
jgi:hypothetical protein